jgi:hypothetical protein
MCNDLWNMNPGVLPSPPVSKKLDARSVLAACLCVMALFFDALGWLLATIGVFLLRRAAFPPRVKWILAAIALAPKILFVGVRSLSAPQGLSFTIEPRTLAASPALWSWSVLLAASGIFLMCAPLAQRRPIDAPVQPGSSGRGLIKAAGLIPIAIAALILSGLTDSFQRIEDAGGGRWALKHAVRGTVATFRRDDLASVEGAESRTRSGASYSVRVALKDGETFSASTTSADPFPELRRFATTAGLRPGTVRIRPRRGSEWTNGASGLTLNDCIGAYEYVDPRTGERSTFEFWLQDGRLAGKETVVEGQRRLVRTLKDIKLSDTGDFEFQESNYAGAESKGSTISISLRWSAQGETGRFTNGGLEVGLKKYRKL